MAKPDHKASPRERIPSSLRATTPLCRPFWLLTEPYAPKHRDLANLAVICSGMRALTSILANSESFRAMQSACDTVEATHVPLDARTTDGLFAALYFLSEQADTLSQPLLDDPDGD